MAGTRRSPPADAPTASRAVEAAVARAVGETVAQDARVAVALSGGRDSVALLAAAAAVRPGRVVALHVHHGLSAHADAWAEFCGELAATLGVPLVVRRVRIAPGDARGVEAAARSARRGALREAARELGVAAILVAHHQDDQAETLLLQLGRGSGPAGLAGMPRARRDDGVLWLRPLLGLPRSALEAFVRERGLAYVDDDSNASDRHRRNALRNVVVPAFAATFPGYPATLARAAAHQADAAQLLDELAGIDLAALDGDRTLDRRGLAALAPHRARNALRLFLRQRGLRAPSLARLVEMHAQLAGARDDAHVELRHDGAIVGLFRGRIVVHAPPPDRFECRWRGESELVLAHGRLRFTRTSGDGVAAARLEGADVVVRARSGGERLQLAADRPRRALKAWLQEAAMPPWERASLPLVFCDGELAAVPGLGADVRFAAGPGAAAYRVDWQPTR